MYEKPFGIERVKHVLLIRFFQISILHRYVEPCYIKGVQIIKGVLFNKVADPRRLHHKCFSMIFAKLLTTPENKTLCNKNNLGPI